MLEIKDIGNAFWVSDDCTGADAAMFFERADAELFVRGKERRAKLMIVLKDISPEARAEVQRAFDEFCRPAEEVRLSSVIDISLR